MESVMKQNFLNQEDIEKRYQVFTETKTYQAMKREKGNLSQPDFSNSIGVDLSFYEEEKAVNAKDMEQVSAIKKGYFIVTNLSDGKLLKALFIHDLKNDIEVVISDLKSLFTKDKQIQIDSFLNGEKQDSILKETSISELKPDPETFQEQSEKGTAFKENQIMLSFPCAGECCTFGGVDYQHCGSNCGVRGDYGGGDLANQLDGCCFVHDDCYHKGKGFCTCDHDLITCARNSTGPGSNTIIAFFIAKTTVCGPIL